VVRTGQRISPAGFVIDVRQRLISSETGLLISDAVPISHFVINENILLFRERMRDRQRQGTVLKSLEYQI